MSEILAKISIIEELIIVLINNITSDTLSESSLS